MPTGESQDKFTCRYCGCRQSQVTNTEVIEREWQRRKLTIVKRRRRCRHCGLSFVTVEHQYEDKVDHEIPNYSGQRPAYDMGRAVGAMEFINGIMKPNEELTAPPPQTGQRPPSLPRQIGKSSYAARRAVQQNIPPQKKPRPKR